MAGLEPARANYSPTDFKSVASTIPPHRRCGVDSKLLPSFAKMHFAVRADSDAVRKSACLNFRNPLKEPQLTQSLIDVPKEKIEISPWRKSAKLQRKGQPPNVRSGKSLPNRRSNRLRRFSFGSKERCLRLAARRTRACRRTKGLRFLHRLICKTRSIRTCFSRHHRRAQPDLGGGSTHRNTILPAVGIITTRQGNF